MGDSLNAESNNGHAFNQASQEERAQNDKVERSPLITEQWITLVLKVSFMLMFIPRFIAIVFFSVFDTQCIVEDNASVVDCEQKTFIANPERWVLVWLLMSIVSSCILLCIIWRDNIKLNYKVNKAKKILKKGSFGSLIFLLIISSIYYAVRIHSTRPIALMRATSWLLFLWQPITVLLVCVLNYLPRVRLQGQKPKCCSFSWWKFIFIQNTDFVIYWLALILYVLELAGKLTAIMLDVAHDVAPLIQSKFPQESSHLKGVMVVVIAFRMALHARLLLFFWQKLFHGEKDLLSEPSDNLDEDSIFEAQELWEHQAPGDAQHENIPMEEIKCKQLS